MTDDDSLKPITAIEPNAIALISNTYITAATSDNTRRAYRSDIKHFEAWGGRLPATPELIIFYLQAYAEQLNVRTLARRVTAIKHWHQYQSFPDPTSHPAVGKTLAGIARIHGRPKEKAWALLPEHIRAIVMQLQADDSLLSIRDNALLQIGFFGAFRRSELTAVRIDHIQWQAEGIDILIPQSKTDPTHQGQYCAIPYGQYPLCPIKALELWLSRAGIKQGPLFRRIFADGRISDKALAAASLNPILKRLAHAARLPFAEKISSHSLRRGLATSASRLGAGIPAIMRQGRWKQVNTVMEYIEASERFKENAASSVLKIALDPSKTTSEVPST